MGVTITVGIASLVQIIIMGIMFAYHYSKTETKNEERYKKMREYVQDHEKRISDLEGSKTQENGQSTYIPRNECLREREKLCYRLSEAEEKIGAHETKIAVIEGKI